MAKTHHRGISYGRRTIWFHVRRSRRAIRDAKTRLFHFTRTRQAIAERIVMKNAEELGVFLYHGSHIAFGIGIIALFFFAVKWAQSGYDNGHAAIEDGSSASVASNSMAVPVFRAGINYMTAGGGTARIVGQSPDGTVVFGYAGMSSSPWSWDATTGRLVGCDGFHGANGFVLIPWEECKEGGGR